MTDPLETRISDELHGRATALDVPPPPIDILVRGGLAVRARRRRRVRVLAAAAAVIAVGLAIGVPQVVDRGGNQQSPAHRPSPGQTKSPKSVDDLPAGSPPVLPYLHAGELHVGPNAVPTSADKVLSAGGTVLVGRGNGDGAHWWELDGATLRPIRQLDGQLGVRLDPSGTVAVWTSYPDAGTTRVNVWDIDKRRETSHVDLPAPHADCCGGGEQVELWGIDAEQAIYWRNADAGGSAGDFVWVPGHQPRRLVGAGDLTGVTPLGPINSSGTYGNVALNGHFERLGQLDGQGPVWSADGSTVALMGPDDASEVVVQRLDDNEASGSGVHLALPAGAEVAAMSFESSDQLLIRVRESAREHVLVRCPTDGGSCERALDMPAPSRWVLPEQLS